MRLKDALVAANQLYWDQQKTKAKEDRVKHRQTNKEAENALWRKRYWENPDEQRRKCRDYYRINREEISKRRREKHKEAKEDKND